MQVKIVEVGLRDGLQNEQKIVPTELKRIALEKLLQAGIRHIEVTSFVHPKWIPQLADAEELLKDLPDNKDGTYSVLIPNMKGMDRATSYPLDEVAVFMSASESHNLKNINKSIQDTFSVLQPVVDAARSKGKKVRGYISTVFGCPYEGKVSVSSVVSICEQLFQMGVDEISLGDTIGIATPNQVKEVLSQLFSQFPSTQFAGHFHDTRGTGLANAYVSLECGISVLDTSFGGLGGCPYAPGAAGNLATEDLVYLLHGMGVKTGINLEQLCEVSQMMGEYLGKPLPSKVLQSVISSRQGAVK
jgi:hydroxymethylglutaryl-CoA lyase